VNAGIVRFGTGVRFSLGQKDFRPPGGTTAKIVEKSSENTTENTLWLVRSVV
jgi:hypothetical protein